MCPPPHKKIPKILDRPSHDKNLYTPLCSTQYNLRRNVKKIKEYIDEIHSKYNGG